MDKRTNIIHSIPNQFELIAIIIMKSEKFDEYPVKLMCQNIIVGNEF